MSRTEKIIAFLLGALVFSGLFVFIFTSLRTPPASPPFSEMADYDDEEEPFDIDMDVDTDIPPPGSETTKETPAVPAPKPAPVQQEKK